MNYQIITNVQEGKPCQLQEYIDNRDGTKKVALIYIKYSKVFYNLLPTKELYKPGFIIINKTRLPLQEGVYSFQEIQGLLKNNGITITMTEIGIVLINLPQNTYLAITAEIATVLGFEPQNEYLYHQQRSTNDQVLRGKKPSKFGMFNDIYVCLEQLDTKKYCLNGAPSTILEFLPAPVEAYNGLASTRFVDPLFKKLQQGYITELTVCLKDEKNNFIKNKDNKITVKLCIK